MVASGNLPSSMVRGAGIFRFQRPRLHLFPVHSYAIERGTSRDVLFQCL